MGRIILRRVLVLVPTLLLATFVVFLLITLIPGDPAITILGEGATTERLAAVRQQLGLNDSFFLQYWHWLSGAAHLDFGRSIISGETVAESLKRTFPTTLHIVVAGLLVSFGIGVPAGVASARRANSAGDQVITTASSLGVAMPSFWLALILVSFVSLKLKLLPATGFVGITSDPVASLKHIALPAIAIGIVGAAEVTRQLRAVMIEVLDSDYVRTLRAKGLPMRRIVWRHALKNCAGQLITIFGLQVNRFLGATVVIEAVFAISGVGTLVVNATQKHDFRVVQGVVMVMVLVVLVTNLFVDIISRLFDPRIR
ncbi:MAG: putative oligopeptide transporter (permease) [Ilumatobacteraceae bacterium]|nr:putative oligopeptide transporter (permease) [Ilumatobacteraceae bacterium]